MHIKGEEMTWNDDSHKQAIQIVNSLITRTASSVLCWLNNWQQSRNFYSANNDEKSTHTVYFENTELQSVQRRDFISSLV